MSSATFPDVVASVAFVAAGRLGRESPALCSYQSLVLLGTGAREGYGRGANASCDRACRRDFLCTFHTSTGGGYASMGVGFETCWSVAMWGTTTTDPMLHWTRDGRSVPDVDRAALCAAAVVSVLIMWWRRRRGGETTGNVRFPPPPGRG